MNLRYGNFNPNPSPKPNSKQHAVVSGVSDTFIRVNAIAPFIAFLFVVNVLLPFEAGRQIHFGVIKDEKLYFSLDFFSDFAY